MCDLYKLYAWNSTGNNKLRTSATIFLAVCAQLKFSLTSLIFASRTAKHGVFQKWWIFQNLHPKLCQEAQRPVTDHHLWRFISTFTGSRQLSWWQVLANSPKIVTAVVFNTKSCPPKNKVSQVGAISRIKGSMVKLTVFFWEPGMFSKKSYPWQKRTQLQQPSGNKRGDVYVQCVFFEPPCVKPSFVFTGVGFEKDGIIWTTRTNNWLQSLCLLSGHPLFFADVKKTLVPQFSFWRREEGGGVCVCVCVRTLTLPAKIFLGGGGQVTWD